MVEETKDSVQMSSALSSEKYPSSPDGISGGLLEITVAEDFETTNYLQGWPLHCLSVALCIAIFLPNVEATITATALVSITDDLQGFKRSSWIITAYLLTYTGFLIVSAKLSDILGRKLLLITSLGLFVVFSGGCGAAQTMTQLIILRAFQGIGAAGTYSLSIVIFFELVPPEKFASYTSMVSAVLAVGLVIGPILGGLITNYTTWRWVFLINVITGTLATILLVITLPTNFPYHGLPESIHGSRKLKNIVSKTNLARVDFLGTTLLLLATILLVVVLEETGNEFEWSSAFAIVVLIASLISWTLFLLWSRRVTKIDGVREPVFPWRFMQSRICIGLIVSIFLTGAPLTITIVQIPLRFQIVNGLSPLQASIRMLPFVVLLPVGTILTASLAGKAKVPPLYLLLGASALQIVGFVLLSTLTSNVQIAAAQYGFQIIVGLGIGSSIASLTVMTPFAVLKRDKSVAVSAQLQFRLMGGAIGLAIVTTVMNKYTKHQLAAILPPEQIQALLKSTKAMTVLPAEAVASIREVFSQGFNIQMRIAIGFCAAQIPSILAMWQKDQIVV